MKTRLYSHFQLCTAPLTIRTCQTTIRSLGTRALSQQPKKQNPPQDAASNRATRDAGSPPPPSVSATSTATNPENNNLLAPVNIPEDPNGVLNSRHPSSCILAQSGLVIQRQIEMMNLFIGFEQANRYVIMDPQGNHVGYMAEHDGGIGKTLTRQWFRTHRAFTTNVFDRSGKEVLRFQRPFSWINTRIRVYDPLRPAISQIPYSSSTNLANADPEVERRILTVPLEAMRIIGEAHSEWVPMRRKYNLFLAHDPSNIPSVSSEIPTDVAAQQMRQFVQFAHIDEPFLSWDFSLLGADKQLIGSVNRNFTGFGREIFTDMGTYALRMDSVELDEEALKSHITSKRNERVYAEVVGGGMTLDQRAVMLATAVTVDYDYFSRHSRGGSGMMLPFMWGGGEAAGGAAGGAATGEAVEGVTVGSAGRAVGGAAAGEGAVAGAGTMAGYEAMQRGMRRDQSAEGSQDPQSPQADQPYEGSQDPQSPQSTDGGDIWGGGNDPWSEGTGVGGSEGGGGFFSWLWHVVFGGD